MNDIGNKEKIILILKKYQSGLTYENLIERFQKEHGTELKNGYVYLKRLKEKGIIETYKTPNTKGKVITYKIFDNYKESKRDYYKLVKCLRFYDKIFKDNIEYLIKNENIKNCVLENEKISNEIEMVLNNS